MASFYIENELENIAVNDFKSVFEQFGPGGGPAKSCRFGVVINLPRIFLGDRNANAFNVINDLSYLCEATELPGRRVDTVDLRYYGPNFKVPYQPVYDDISMTFVCRNDQQEREFFDDWMEKINPSDTYNFNYKDDYSTTITMFQFDDQSLPSYAFTIYEAYPIFVNPQPVTWVDDNFQRLTVTFTYMNWRRKNKDQQYTRADVTPRKG